eukprot:snap_masked-scaffold_37-processed-gene-1.9-mRNA-1 protein AED:1.00 eAED:1.00 QI:0/0/0/0/1/1/2/0/68
MLKFPSSNRKELSNYTMYALSGVKMGINRKFRIRKITVKLSDEETIRVTGKKSLNFRGGTSYVSICIL